MSPDAMIDLRNNKCSRDFKSEGGHCRSDPHLTLNSRLLLAKGLKLATAVGHLPAALWSATAEDSEGQ